LLSGLVDFAFGQLVNFWHKPRASIILILDSLTAKDQLDVKDALYKAWQGLGLII
jgi:hypothetical protein